MAVVTMFQRFEFRMVDPNYTLELKQSLTIKPKDFHVRAHLRTDANRLTGLTTASPKVPHVDKTPKLGTTADEAGKTPLYVVYGSNSGTSEAFAQRIAGAASSNGFSAKIGTLNSITGHVPTNGPLIVVTASYEGQYSKNEYSSGMLT